tara:strand:- start:1908 stop:2486 length:579 start_codon:yes stop_codon:yes gene_type:complete
MSVTLPVLLLIIGGMSLWLLSESKLKWHLKTASIATYCIFTIIFWSTIHSYLGWPALENDLPDKVLVHWVVVKEPNKQTGYKGDIFFLLESAEDDRSFLMKIFGYKGDNPEPRLFGVAYSRGLHEQIENQIRGKLQRGQPVFGSLSKLKGEGKGKNGKGVPNGKKGGGSESQEQEWQFHILRPSDFLNKPEE